jgi:hypothetical protein
MICIMIDNIYIIISIILIIIIFSILLYRNCNNSNNISKTELSDSYEYFKTPNISDKVVEKIRKEKNKKKVNVPTSSIELKSIKDYPPISENNFYDTANETEYLYASAINKSYRVIPKIKNKIIKPPFAYNYVFI